MGILSTNTHLIGVNAGGSVTGAVRYDIEQNLTPEEQAQARENIGFEGALKEYSGGPNIKIQDYIVSVTGKKGLMIEDRSMTANETTSAIEIGVKDEYVQGIAEETVNIVIDQKIQDDEIITTIFRDNSLSGNGTQGSPLGIAEPFLVHTDTTLTGDGTTASPIGIANEYKYTSPSGTSYIDNDLKTIEQSNSAIGTIETRNYTIIGSSPHMEENQAPGRLNHGINLKDYQGQWFNINIWTTNYDDTEDHYMIFKEYNGVQLPPIKLGESVNYEFIVPEGDEGTLWYGLDSLVTADRVNVNFERYSSSTTTTGVRELAWKDDVTQLESQVSTNTVNIDVNTMNIASVTTQANDTWTYIQEHEPSWGAQIKTQNGITGTGSTTSPLGLSALKVANSLSGDGVTSNIGLTADYALASDLQNTQQAVVNNTNYIGDLQQSYDSLNYTVENHSDNLLSLNNSVATCEQNIQVNSDNIDTISGDMVSFLEIGSRGQTAYRKKLFASATNMEGAQEHLYAESNATTHSTSDLGYTVTSAVAESLPKLGYVHDLQYYSNPNTYTNNKNKIDYINCSDFDTAAWVEGAIMLTCSKPCSLTIMPLTGSPETLSDWNMQGKNINMPSVIAGHPVTIPFLWSNFDSPILAIGIKGSDNITKSDISYNHWHIHGKRGN